MLGDHDTIAAIGTARGVGALGIVRLSGERTPEVLARCFVSKGFEPQESHKASFGVWQNPQTEQAIDEVVVLNFSGGRGYTGEASADIICHGGVQVTDLVLEAALTAGARLARPGEFTYRAVMNNKLDLARAESVLEIIQAKTPRAVANALKNIRGALSEKLEHLESDIVFLLANLEASIDFTAEDIQPVNFSEMKQLAERSLGVAEELLQTYVAGRLANQGLKVVLAGKPNAGKSSLSNALLGKQRSIVTDLPGTTRDTIEEDVFIDGHLFRITDTAGLRKAESAVEEQGIERALDEIKNAELVLYVVDSAAGLENDDVEYLKEIGADRGVIAFNKSDLKSFELNEVLARFGLQNFKTMKTSAISDFGIKELKTALLEFIKTAGDSETAVVVSTQRQREGLLKIQECLEKSRALLKDESSPEFVAFELKDALLATQNLLGKSAGDDVMDRVFKEFCIGK